MLKVLGVEAGDGRKVARWVGVGMWVVAVFFTCVGGKIAEKIELVGVICAIAIGWFLPCGFAFWLGNFPPIRVLSRPPTGSHEEILLMKSSHQAYSSS